MAALSVVQAQQNSVNGTGNVAVTITTTANNLLAVFAGQGVDNTTNVTISDSASQTWSQSAAGYSRGTGVTTISCTWWFKANSAAVTSVTTSWGSINGRKDAIVYEISGAATSTPEDTSVNNKNDTASTTYTTGSFTTTNANDILLAGYRLNGAFTSPAAGSGATIPTNGTSARAITEFKIVAATQTSQTLSATSATSLATVNSFVAFKAASGGTNITVTLTGSSMTTTAGNLTESGDSNLTISGSSMTGTAGTLTPAAGASVSLTGSSMTSSTGNVSVTGSANVPITGSAITATAGNLSITGSANVSLIGSSLTITPGTLTVSIGGSITVAITGQSITASAGTLSMTGDANVSLTGSSIVSTTGAITVTVPGAVTAHYIPIFRRRRR